MKRWAIRISALSAVVALGWFTVAWAQRQSGPGDVPFEGPDFSKAPVNADAAGLVANNPGSTAMPSTGSSVTPVSVTAESSGGAPVDPFASAAKAAGDRYKNFGPKTLDPDPNASALATETSEIATKQASHNEVNNPYAMPPHAGSGAEAATADHSAGQADNASAPVDPFAMKGANVLRNPSAVSDDTMQAGAADGAMSQRADDKRYGQYGSGSDRSATAPAPPANAYDAPQQTGGQTPDAAPPPSYAGNGAPSSFGSSRNDRYNDIAPPPQDDNYRRNPAMDTGANNSLRNPSGDSLPASPSYPQDLGSRERPKSILPPQDEIPASTNAYASSGNMMRGGTMGGNEVYGASASVPVNVEGYGRPGDKKLEGAQTPSVTIQKTAPPEIQVGKPAKFEIVVRNTGPVVAENVEVIEAVPQGTKLLSTNPQTQSGQRGEIVWKVGELKPAEEMRLQVELMPIEEGEIGSVAVVHFSSQASVRTIATKPELVLELNAPKQVMIGGEVTVGIKISNPGTGAAEKIVLHEVVPQGFQHPAGGELEFDVGMLRPGESRQLDLTLRAVQAGMFGNTISVTGDANLRAEQTAQIQIVAPALEVAIDGPGLRYLERQAKYNVSVNNPGTAPAKDIELVTRLPKGMQFVEASDMGHYDKNSHAVIWSLAELPAGQSGGVTLTTLATEPGEQKLRTEGRASGGLSHTNEETTIVEGVAAVLFTVVDVDDPVEVSGQATYEIKVVNQGSKAASRVTVVAQLPPELKAVKAEGPAQHRMEGQRIVFEPMARLAPKADITYRIVAQAVAPGDSRIRVLLQTDEMTEPVTKEESTRIYKD